MCIRDSCICFCRESPCRNNPVTNGDCRDKIICCVSPKNVRTGRRWNSLSTLLFKVWRDDRYLLHCLIRVPSRDNARTRSPVQRSGIITRSDTTTWFRDPISRLLSVRTIRTRFFEASVFPRHSQVRTYAFLPPLFFFFFFFFSFLACNVN